MNALSKYGTHRVIEPKGVLPQAAYKIDPTPVCLKNEMLIDVDILNIDSASFHQIKEACQHDETKMKDMILGIVNTQGKMQNPVTKSGGMLIGRVKEIGPDFSHNDVHVGDTLATLVSLSLTPLHIDEITSINLTNEQVKIKGQAILFDSGIYAIIPEDLDQKLALAALDVCGAPAQVMKLAKKNQTVFILGASGKSGLLCAYVARNQVGPNGKVIGLIHSERYHELLNSFGFCDEIIVGDAVDSIHVMNEVARVTDQKMADLTINCVNVENTEMTSILATKDEGTVYFFSMATSFTKAALGAEGISKDVQMIIGNGYTKNHAQITLDIMRKHKGLHDLFMERYA